jgi:hypothetical protein
MLGTVKVLDPFPENSAWQIPEAKVIVMLEVDVPHSGVVAVALVGTTMEPTPIKPTPITLSDFCIKFILDSD